MGDVGLLLALQQYRQPALDMFFHFFAFLGSEYFYIAILSWIFWCVDRVWGIRLAIVLFASFYTNFTLKEVFAMPRPVHPELIIMEQPEGLAFPSGHAQSSATFWVYLGLWLRKVFLWIPIAILVILNSLSRLYLGIHLLQDVVAGAILGIVFAVTFFLLFRALERSTFNFPLFFRCTAGAIVGIIMYAFALDDLAVRMSGCMAATLVGFPLQKRYFPFSLPQKWQKKIPFFLGGLATVVLLHLTMRTVMGRSDPFIMIRYFILIMWVVLGVPILFRCYLTKNREVSRGEILEE